MNRRTFLASTLVGTVAASISNAALAAERYFPVKVDQTLFESINRTKDAGKKTPLELTHAPFISAPKTVKAGEVFLVEVSVGEKIHVMGQAHWIEYIELSIGNEPAGRVDFQSKGYMKPKVTFAVELPKDSAPNGIISLVATQRCNLHGIWESTLDIKVV